MSATSRPISSLSEQYQVPIVPFGIADSGFASVQGTLQYQQDRGGSAVYVEVPVTGGYAPTPDILMFCADGAGGSERGDVAASEVRRNFYTDVSGTYIGNRPMFLSDRLGLAIDTTNRQILRQPYQTVSTLVAALIDGRTGNFALANWGDSSHLFVFPRERKMVSHRSMFYPQGVGNVISGYLGGDPQIRRPQIITGKMADYPHSIYAQYSDGVPKVLGTDGAIASRIGDMFSRGASLQQIADAIMKDCRGGNDNATIALLQVGNAPLTNNRSEVAEPLRRSWLTQP